MQILVIYKYTISQLWLGKAMFWLISLGFVLQIKETVVVKEFGMFVLEPIYTR